MKKLLLVSLLFPLSAAAMGKKQPFGRGDESDNEFERSQPHTKRIRGSAPSAPSKAIRRPRSIENMRDSEDIDSGNEADIEFERSQPHRKRVRTVTPSSLGRTTQRSSGIKKMRSVKDIDVELEQLQPRLKHMRLSPAPGMSLSALNQRLFDAAAVNNIRAADEALKQGADANVKDPTGRSLLYSAALQNRDGYEMARLLLQYGADPDVRYGAIRTVPYDSNPVTHRGAVSTVPYWSTLLHIAVQDNKPELAALLIEYGANPHIENISGKNPLDIARQQYGEQSALYTMIKDATTEYDRKRFKSRVEGIPTQNGDDELKNLQEHIKRMRVEEKG